MLNGKDMIMVLIIGLIKKIQLQATYKNESNYATKTDLKNVTHVDTSSFELTPNLANLKSEVDKLDIDKLAPVPVDLSRLKDVVKTML